MSGTARLLAWLDRASDRVSPLVVKEARQAVRGREFLFSFMASLFAGLVVAFVGATEALAGSSTSGRWTFAALVGCLACLGLAVVPLGAYSTLRQERLEQTLDLITLTALSSRRILVGKLLAQSVKLLMLFAAIAPFLAMSFLLGGIDFTTILIALVLLYMGSVWAGAFCLFLSTLFKSRAASGLAFGIIGLLVVALLLFGANLFTVASRGLALPTVLGLGSSFAARAKEFGVLLTFWAVTLVNLVLLAENRLSLATEDTVSPLRVGFFVQFLLMAGWALLFLFTLYSASMPAVLSAFGSLHLAVVAAFVLAEPMSVPRRVLRRMHVASGWGRLLGLFGPGAGRGAVYILAQMAILAIVVAICDPPALELRRVLASCGYICFFTGVPVLAFWRIAPSRVTQIRVRVTILCGVAAALVLPDLLHYAIVQPEILNITYSARHLLNPFRSIMEWRAVEANGWVAIAFAIGVTGVLAYLRLIWISASVTSRAMREETTAVVVDGEAGRGGVLY